jgi:hypothetical protein
LTDEAPREKRRDMKDENVENGKGKSSKEKAETYKEKRTGKRA